MTGMKRKVIEKIKLFLSSIRLVLKDNKKSYNQKIK